MSWLSKLMPSGIRTDNVPSKKRSVPEGLWEKCSSCGSALVSVLDGSKDEGEAARRAGDFLRPLREALDGLAAAA